MANDINRVIVSGRATRDPEVRRTQGGMAIMSFGIAVNDRRKNPQTGEWEDVAGFYDCAMFGNRAESLANFIAKGMQLMVEGKLRYSKWERNGETKSKVEIIAEEVVLPPRRDGQGGAQGGYGQQAGGYAYGGGNAPQAASQRPQGGYGQPSPQQQWSDQQYAQSQGGYQQAVQQQAQVSADIYADEEIPF